MVITCNRPAHAMKLTASNEINFMRSHTALFIALCINGLTSKAGCRIYSKILLSYYTCREYEKLFSEKFQTRPGTLLALKLVPFFTHFQIMEFNPGSQFQRTVI
jgi:hypothetical protein